MKIKESIDARRRERLLVKKVIQRLRKERGGLTEQTVATMEIAAGKQAAISEIEEEIAVVKARLETQKGKSKVEMDELEDTLRLQQKHINEMNHQAHKEILESRNSRSHVTLPQEDAPSGTMSGEENTYKALFKVMFFNAVQRSILASHQKSLEVYTRALDLISSSTGLTDIDEIAAVFQSIEDRNYSIMMYVNERSTEIEKLQGQRRELLARMREKISSAEKTNTSKRHEAMAEAEERFERCSSFVNQETKVDQVKADEYKECLQIMESLYKKLRGSEASPDGSSAADGLEGDSNDEDHLLKILAFLESRAATLFPARLRNRDRTSSREPQSGKATHKNAPQDSRRNAPAATASAGNPQSSGDNYRVPKVAATPGATIKVADLPATTTAATQEDSSDDDDELSTRPLSLAELCEKTNASGAKKKKGK
eukprot:GHVU01147198.1.p1 GENE.GHVU01147198.1~~GHVU01147198.1.p1  ORF type:complete len:428 (-),score=89.09 GHVU01147198.1:534-1817(-)